MKKKQQKTLKMSMCRIRAGRGGSFIFCLLGFYIYIFIHTHTHIIGFVSSIQNNLFVHVIGNQQGLQASS